MQPTQFAQTADDVFGNPALVERLSAALSDSAQRLRKFRLTVDAPGDRRGAILEKDTCSGGAKSELTDLPSPVARQPFRHCITFVGRVNRGSQQAIEAQGSVIGHQTLPCGYRARYGHRVCTCGVDRRQPALQEPIRVCASRRPTRTVHGVNRPRAARHVEREAVAADSGLRRLYDSKHCRRGHGGIHGVATPAQNIERASNLIVVHIEFVHLCTPVVGQCRAQARSVSCQRGNRCASGAKKSSITFQQLVRKRRTA